MKTKIRYRQYTMVMVMLIHTILIGCGEGDDPEPENSLAASATAVAIGPEGASLTITYADQSTEKISGGQILGWVKGRLLEGNYLRSLRIVTSKGTMQINLNVPKDTQFNDILEQSHTLQSSTLLLQNTANLAEVYPELFFSSSEEFDRFENFDGRVTFEKNVSSPLTTYELVGEIDIENDDVEIQGYFWAEDIEE